MSILNQPTEGNLEIGLIVGSSGASLPVSPAALEDDDSVTSLRQHCASCPGALDFHVRGILLWPDKARWHFLRLLSEFKERCRVQLNGNPAQFTDPFDAVLAALHGLSNVELCERSRRLAIEAAAVLHPTAIDLACGRIIEAFRGIGVRHVDRRKLITAASELIGISVDNSRSPTAAAQAFLEWLDDDAGRADSPVETSHFDEETRDDGAEEFTGGLAEQSRDQDVESQNLRGDYQEDGEEDMDAIEPEITIPALLFFRGDFFRRTNGSWGRVSEEEIRVSVTGFLQQNGGFGTISSKFVGDIILNLRGLTNLENWDAPMPFWIESVSPLRVERPRLVALANGMVDIDEPINQNGCASLFKLDRRWFSPVQLPYTYDPNAPCPLWLETLGVLLPRTEQGDHRIEVLQEFMGLTLIPGDVSYQKFLILLGEGNNGKSTILAVWEALLGPENVSHVPLDRFGGEFRLVEMMDKLANIAGDMNHVDRIAEGILKQLVTGDPIQANRKNRAMVTMTPSARLIFGANEFPTISDRSDGVWRRAIGMPFYVQLEPGQVDIHRPQRLLDELPGIFNWVVEGAVRLSRRGQITRCSVCTACVSEHRVHCDPVRQFILERLIVSQELSVPKDLVYEAYSRYCVDSGYQAKNKANFCRDLLRDRRIQPSRPVIAGARQQVFVGVDLDRAVPQNRDFPRPNRPRG